jgi:hypothetical protein
LENLHATTTTNYDDRTIVRLHDGYAFVELLDVEGDEVAGTYSTVDGFDGDVTQEGPGGPNGVSVPSSLTSLGAVPRVEQIRGVRLRLVHGLQRPVGF